MNHSFTLDMADALAKRLESEAGDDLTAQVDRGFVLVFGRTPLETESDASVQLVEQHGLIAFCRVLLNTNEFIYLQ